MKELDRLQCVIRVATGSECESTLHLRVLTRHQASRWLWPLTLVTETVCLVAVAEIARYERQWLCGRKADRPIPSTARLGRLWNSTQYITTHPRTSLIPSWTHVVFGMIADCWRGWPSAYRPLVLREFSHIARCLTLTIDLRQLGLTKSHLFGICDECSYQALLSMFDLACELAGWKNEPNSSDAVKRGSATARGGAQKRGRVR